ncbi:putative pyruvate dehydrogenase complex component Pdx1 [Aspergillus campestris IBT 28561]|uniref:Pyruvate dehydrogenase complex component Pdx1 n=1 Tax=Aspergillus campestris (strain IBT 28561) TaxID=1392248 RepID=A0A2I1D7Y0_ASPC2|nr:putative pyruvate dehydrogenase complex component Pdx1 [Aspergillus campestris IBT 28561]PKY05982.1 putative pyruvate dehydrogenase complex component Pdx1 [Aspergillus campestris IBT 28561]
MSASLPSRQIPAFLARRQPRVLSTGRRFQSSSAGQTQNPSYPLYPSVSQLLHQNGIPESDLSKIPASGPKGRLLKGDVLAYIGAIPRDYPSSQAQRLEQLSHLDLSNIKIAAPPAPAEPAKVEEPEKPVARAPPTTSVAVSISLAAVLSVQNKLSETLGVNVPLSTFLARAADLANDDLPRSSTDKRSADELFDEVLGADPIVTSRGDYIPELNAFDGPIQSAPRVQDDLIDLLSGQSKKRTATRVAAAPEEPATNVFSLTVPLSDKKRAQTFLDRVQALLTVEPGRLVL